MKHKHRQLPLERIVQGGALLVAATGATALIFGWGLGSEPFIRAHGKFAAMVPSTAIAFLVLGAALLAFARSGPARAGSKLLLAAALFVAAGAALDLVFLTPEGAGGLDAVLWPSLLRHQGDKMAVATALCFLLAALCVAQLALRRINTTVFVGAATVGLLLCSFSLVSYVLGYEMLYGALVFTAMALQTAIAFAVLFVCLMLAARGRGWIWLLFGQRVGSIGARLMAPIVIAGPLLLSFFALQATKAGLFTVTFRLSLMAIAMMAIGLVAVLRNAAIENRAEDSLRVCLVDLEIALADRSLLLREVYHRVKNNLQQINAMLLIERGKLADPQAIESFKTVSSRVEALGMVHQLLIQAAKPSEVELSDYFSRLCDCLTVSNGLESRAISLHVKAAADIVHLDIAMTLGLLTNELVGNAIKHAFSGAFSGALLGEQKANIYVAYGDRSATEKELTVRDDGKGFGDNPARSFGSVIVDSLVGQLRGTMTIEQGGGTTVSVVFPAKRNGEGRGARG